jgi:hypothetical protein
MFQGDLAMTHAQTIRPANPTTTRFAGSSRFATSRFALSHAHTHIVLFAALLALLFAEATPAQAQWWSWGKGKRGSGNIVKTTRDLSGFTGIDLTGSDDAFVTAGSKQEVRIESDDNIIEDIVTEVRGGVLYVGMKNGNYNNTHTKIYITIPTLDLLRLTGSGDVTVSDGFTMNTMEIKLSGSGDIRFGRATAKNLNITLSGSGDITAGDLESENVAVRLSGSGDIRVNAKSSLDARVSGSGDIVYRGSPQQVSKSVSGSGDIRQKN